MTQKKKEVKKQEEFFPVVMLSREDFNFVFDNDDDIDPRHKKLFENLSDTEMIRLGEKLGDSLIEDFWAQLEYYVLAKIAEKKKEGKQ